MVEPLPLGGDAHRLVGEVIGDDAAPAIGAKGDFDVRHGCPYRTGLRSTSAGRRPSAVRSDSSISRIICAKLIFGRPPGRARALLGSPHRCGTSAGRKYARSTSTYLSP